MKVLFAGDIHANAEHLNWVLGHAQMNDVGQVIAVGNFGYWPHSDAGYQFLREANRLAEEFSIPIGWLDGNEEDHGAIHALIEAHGGEAPIATGGSMVFYLPRGCVLQVGGKSVLAYGGAWSIDWMDRLEGIDWWPAETIDFDHMEMVADRVGQVDVLVTHECPAGGPVGHRGEHPMAAAQQLYVGHLMDRVGPRLVVSGHHHQWMGWNDPVTGAPVYVLGRDGQGEASVLIVDMDDLAITG